MKFITTGLIFLSLSTYGDGVSLVEKEKVIQSTNSSFYLQAGVGSSGGGDHIRHYFFKEAKELIHLLKTHKTKIEQLLSFQDLEKILDVNKVVVTDKQLIDRTSSIVDALGKKGHIVLNRKSWRSFITQSVDTKWLVLHEMLRFYGINDDNYRVSNEIISQIPDILPNFKLYTCHQTEILIKSSVPLLLKHNGAYERISKLTPLGPRFIIETQNQRTYTYNHQCSVQNFSSGLAAQIAMDRLKIERMFNVNIRIKNLKCIDSPIFRGWEGAFIGTCTTNGEFNAPDSYSLFAINSAIKDSGHQMHYTLNVLDGQDIDPLHPIRLR